MRKADIEVGGIYALRFGDNYGLTQRVEVLEVGVERPTRRSIHAAHVRPDKVRDGVRVRFLDSHSDREEVVQTRTIRMTWDEHEERLRQQAEARERQERLTEEQRERQQRLTERLNVHDVRARYSSLGPHTVVIPESEWDAMEALLDRLNAAEGMTMWKGG